MAVKAKYRIKNSEGEYQLMHFETSADQVITNDNKQFVTSEEKQKINKAQHYTHTQEEARTEWIIKHNLNKFPSVSIVDDGGTLVMGDIVYVDANQVKIKFLSAFSGKAYLN